MSCRACLLVVVALSNLLNLTVIIENVRTIYLCTYHCCEPHMQKSRGSGQPHTETLHSLSLSQIKHKKKKLPGMCAQTHNTNSKSEKKCHFQPLTHSSTHPSIHHTHPTLSWPLYTIPLSLTPRDDETGGEGYKVQGDIIEVRLPIFQSHLDVDWIV